VLKLAEAQTIVGAGLTCARERALPPMTIAVLDARGCTLSLAMEDGSSLLRDRIATAKAQGALGMGAGSRSFVAKAAAHPGFFVALNGLTGGGVVPVPGGVLVRDATGRILGAVGVSGHMPDSDEAIALAGIDATGLTADAGED
jgi:Uncharacterized protein, possibly involved in utilization of glycolate and propanediol